MNAAAQCNLLIQIGKKGISVVWVEDVFRCLSLPKARIIVQHIIANDGKYLNTPSFVTVLN